MFQVAGAAFWQGSDLMIRNHSECCFSADGSTCWGFDSLEPTMWRWRSSKEVLSCPGVLENRSAGLRLETNEIKTRLTDFEFVNDGEFEVVGSSSFLYRLYSGTGKHPVC
ncbi:MAG: hypothetical protein M2R45_05344 [Verrucomicrobia subdivision 3 bacterium]|nr:hypothetical protein [Limisphaerales bacterium]MCS1417840.1 hypothetical protein [Limisphaerales bacterium]